MSEISLKPIGRVISSVENPEDMPLGGKEAVIEVYPEYQEALLRLEENSHIWVLSWFHKAPRHKLKTRPYKVNPDLPEYGAFALRSIGRPNPIGLSLARLVRIKDNRLYLESLDAIGGTPVLDIKPYFENDIVFSPRTSYIPGKNREMRHKQMLRQAMAHHQEKCPGMGLGVRMALIAQEYFGHINSTDLVVEVTGSWCLADTIQGLARARLANPSRFYFTPSGQLWQTCWTKGNSRLTLTLKGAQKDILGELPDEELLIIEFK
ncbi:tRNA (N6-threonylcarbamoyladenosine(37)-N6)-methyltransferase TrmO [Syntrophomonas erecta]